MTKGEDEGDKEKGERSHRERKEGFLEGPRVQPVVSALTKQRNCLGGITAAATTRSGRANSSLSNGERSCQGFCANADSRFSRRDRSVKGLRSTWRSVQ